MRKFKIAVGTTSKQKIEYLEEVLCELKIKHNIYPVEVESGVSDQPVSIEETKKGSVNRAKRALDGVKEADFGIGIEIGYHKEKNLGYQIFCAVTIIDSNKNEITSESHKLLLPKYHQNILEKNESLGKHVHDYLKNTKVKNHTKKHLDEVIRFRRPFIENALKTSLIQYLNLEDF